MQPFERRRAPPTQGARQHVGVDNNTRRLHFGIADSTIFRTYSLTAVPTKLTSFQGAWNHFFALSCARGACGGTCFRGGPHFFSASPRGKRSLNKEQNHKERWSCFDFDIINFSGVHACRGIHCRELDRARCCRHARSCDCNCRSTATRRKRANRGGLRVHGFAHGGRFSVARKWWRVSMTRHYDARATPMCTTGMVRIRLQRRS